MLTTTTGIVSRPMAIPSSSRRGGILGGPVDGPERLAARFPREGVHLVIGLQEVHALHGAHILVGHDAKGLHDADRIDGNPAFLDRFAGFVECKLTKSIAAGCDQQDGFASFDIAHSLHGIHHRIEHVRFRKSWNTQALHGFLSLHPVHGEIGKNLGPHVESYNRHVVLGL